MKSRKPGHCTQPLHSRLWATKKSGPAAPQRCVLPALPCVLHSPERAAWSKSWAWFNVVWWFRHRIISCSKQGSVRKESRAILHVWDGPSPSILSPRSRGFGASWGGGDGLLPLGNNGLGSLCTGGPRSTLLSYRRESLAGLALCQTFILHPGPVLAHLILTKNQRHRRYLIAILQRKQRHLEVK